MRSLVGCLAAVLLLAGCTAEPAPEPTGTVDAAPSSPAAEPEEAERIAAAAYARYLALANEILNEGGAEPDRIDQVVAEGMAESEKAGYEQYAERGLRTVGEATFDSLSIQSYQPGAEAGETAIVAYLCSDSSAVDVVNGAGDSVLEPDRDSRSPFEVHFAYDREGQLLVSAREPWSGENFCQ
ncbi:hypothetical protein [Desertivibrio insolitus]|uniref:hypothetical protein n=1 Tax=Herbiconiux sp. SYSU D00978 TaxID=2812562 RepID=UPI001A95FA94|nr:hypothetical protein [Herbiconiux sp. SYSU D00978]